MLKLEIGDLRLPRLGAVRPVRHDETVGPSNVVHSGNPFLFGIFGVHTLGAITIGPIVIPLPFLMFTWLRGGYIFDGHRGALGEDWGEARARAVDTYGGSAKGLGAPTR